MRGPKISSDFRLETERTYLRKFALNDIPFVFSASRFPHFCDGMKWNPPASPEELVAPCEANQKAWDMGVGYTFTIVEKNTGQPVGRIAIRHETDEIWNLGFWTHPEHQSRGFMTEAAARVLDWGFEVLKAERIVAAHADWNRASRRVLEKIGMRFVRHLPDGFEKNGQWVAEDLLEIRAADWQRKQS